jgi:hypothetical protein
MSVTPASDLAGVLPVVISGGRPALDERRTARFLPALQGVTADPVWVVRDDQAAGYEPDGREIVTYPLADAEAYAATHWTAPERFRPGAFLGAFAGREWACRIAEQRGYWAVLQLDDNLRDLRLFTGYGMTSPFTYMNGGLGLFADLLAAVTLSTNSVMTGAALDAVEPSSAIRSRQLARPGFPYSLFIERLGPGREEWYGPTEDDILHAYQYATNPSPATAAIVTPLHYIKVPGGGTGMRAHYDHGRAAGLQRAAPEMAAIRVLTAHANGRGQPRVFHQMKAGAIASRAPLAVTDRDLYLAAVARTNDLAAELAAGFRPRRVERLRARAAKWDTPPS